jgi:hypothetical protein
MMIPQLVRPDPGPGARSRRCGRLVTSRAMASATPAIWNSTEPALTAGTSRRRGWQWRARSTEPATIVGWSEDCSGATIAQCCGARSHRLAADRRSGDGSLGPWARLGGMSSEANPINGAVPGSWGWAGGRPHGGRARIPLDTDGNGWRSGPIACCCDLVHARLRRTASANESSRPGARGPAEIPGLPMGGGARASSGSRRKRP